MYERALLFMFIVKIPNVGEKINWDTTAYINIHW